MARKFYTSDWHLSSSGIIALEHRPFKTTEKMNEHFVRMANMKAKNHDDVIIHVGDFLEYGDDNHYRNERFTKGEKISPSVFINQLNASFVNIEGNHDASNRVKSIGRFLFTDLGNFHDVSVGHYPSNDPKAAGTFISYAGRRHWTVRICGHVHSAWKWYFDPVNRILNINVGADVWRYNIVSESDLLGYIGSITNEVNRYTNGVN